jgi:hypothetical protein
VSVGVGSLEVDVTADQRAVDLFGKTRWRDRESRR